ncbi:MAG: hypothetical protein R3242_10570 [Akkermansiaceae bacterium]|nr:hypothetical protein [Akkermansiaceae bacterium]
MNFAESISEPMHALASEVLEARNYARLKIVSQYLAVLEAGQWSRLGSDERELFLNKMNQDFHPRAWDDWSYDQDDSYRKVIDLIESAMRATKQ